MAHARFDGEIGWFNGNACLRRAVKRPHAAAVPRGRVIEQPPHAARNHAARNERFARLTARRRHARFEREIGLLNGSARACGVRLNDTFYESDDWFALDEWANILRERYHGNLTYFNVNTHLNPTNVRDHALLPGKTVRGLRIVRTTLLSAVAPVRKSLKFFRDCYFVLALTWNCPLVDMAANLGELSRSRIMCGPAKVAGGASSTAYLYMSRGGFLAGPSGCRRSGWAA